MTKSEIRELAVDCTRNKLLSDVLIDMKYNIEDRMLHLDYDDYKLIRKVVRLAEKNIKVKA